MIHILYLAAGSARRFGSNKLLAHFKGKPLYASGLDTLEGFAKEHAECSLTVISRYDEILKDAESRSIAAVNSPLSEGGLSYSIQAGIESLAPLPREDFLLFVLSDQPYLSAESLSRMTAAARPGTLCATACFDGVPGSPTLFSARLVPELLQLQNDEGGRRVMKRHPDETLWVELPRPEELWDIDTVDDLKGDSFHGKN